MKMDKVIFRKFEDDQIIAIFPEIPGTMSFHTCQSYINIVHVMIV
jgi:hypothetical protein